MNYVADLERQIAETESASEVGLLCPSRHTQTLVSISGSPN